MEVDVVGVVDRVVGVLARVVEVPRCLEFLPPTERLWGRDGELGREEGLLGFEGVPSFFTEIGRREVGEGGWDGGPLRRF